MSDAIARAARSFGVDVEVISAQRAGELYPLLRTDVGQHRAGAGEGIEGANLAVQFHGRQAEVQCRFVLADLGGARIVGAK